MTEKGREFIQDSDVPRLPKGELEPDDPGSKDSLRLCITYVSPTESEDRPQDVGRVRHLHRGQPTVTEVRVGPYCTPPRTRVNVECSETDSPPQLSRGRSPWTRPLKGVLCGRGVTVEETTSL